MSEVLVVAGEPSGDRIAALAARVLHARGARCVGVGGPACRAAGVELLADASELAAMGLGDVLRRAPALARGAARLLGQVRRRPPAAALLVNFTEANQRLGRHLRGRGVPVLWCVAPQVWAWRPGRLESLRGSFDRLAVILPFEEHLWRAAGHDARYVGHPALEPTPPPAEGRAPRLAVLPGSRAGEVRRLARPLCEAAALLRREVPRAEVLASAGLDPRARSVVEASARASGLDVALADETLGAAPRLASFTVALCASGTASLEAALAGAPPVVAYRLDPVAYAVARRLVRTPHIALPNVVLGRRAFPELLQDEVTAPRLAAAARALLARDDGPRLAAELRERLAPPGGGTFGERVAELLSPWLR